MELRYIPLTEEGNPTVRLRDGGLPWDEVLGAMDIAVLVPEPFIVLDFDVARDAEIMRKIVEGEDLQVRMLQTDRGIHVWFKSPHPWKNFVGSRLAIGLTSDCKSYGKLTFTKIRKGGEDRVWIRDTRLEDVQTVPRWLYTLAYGGNSFVDMGDGDGRNQVLFSYIQVLQRQGFTRDEVKETLRIINTYVFRHTLSKEEMSNILRDEAFVDDSTLPDPEVTQKMIESGVEAFWFDEKGNFHHNIMAEYLMRELDIVTYHGQTYVYRDGWHQPDPLLIEKRIIELAPTLKLHQRREVVSQIATITARQNGSIDVDPYKINLPNGRLNLHTGALEPHDPKHLDFQRVPTEYHPTASSSVLDGMLNKVFCGDQQMIGLFYEIVGYTLLRSNRYRKGFIFLGDGSNGKSTILNLIRAMLGDANCSSIEMDKLTDKFKTAELEDKLLNISDDVTDKTQGDTGTLKKLFTGEMLMVERKNQQPFGLSSFAKLLFACNKMPRIMDKTHGMYDRLVILPFNATFSKDDKDWDPNIEDKLSSPRCHQALLAGAVEGLKRLMKQGFFSIPDASKEALDTYKEENSTTLSWASDMGYDRDFLHLQDIGHMYRNFRSWCLESGFRYPPSRRSFVLEVNSSLNMTSILRWSPELKLSVRVFAKTEDATDDAPPKLADPEAQEPTPQPTAEDEDIDLLLTSLLGVD